MSRKTGFPMLVLVAIVLGSACAEPRTIGINGSNVDVVSWAEAVEGDRLDEETIARFAGFRGTIPEELPETAYPVAQVLLGIETRNLVAADPSGVVRMTLIIDNPDTKAHRERVVCLRDGRATACHPAMADDDIEIAPDSIALVQLQIAAQPGDRLTILRLPEGQVGTLPGPRGMAGAYQLAVDGTAPTGGPAVGVEFLRERLWPFQGCDLARILKETPPLVDGVRIPNRVAADDPLFLVVELCEETQPALLDLVLIGDRHIDASPAVAPWDGEFELDGDTLLIPIEREWVAGLEEFQVIVLMRRAESDEFPGIERDVLFSDAVGFADQTQD